jgi:dTDP-4-amino-4,6-dideoxygalactose transaminase
MCYYPVPLHLQQAFAHLGYKAGDFPVSETLANEVVSLPMYPELSDDHIATIATNIQEIVSQRVGFVPANVATAAYSG